MSAAVGRALGVRVLTARPVPGGDINDALRVELADGRTLFVKHRRGASGDMYRAEADGLAWLAEAGAIAVPEVVAVGVGEPAFLALGWIERGRPVADHDERLGRALAALHRVGAPAFGLHRPGAIGPIALDNRPCATWAEFYALRRLAPLGRLAHDRGALDATGRAHIERLCERLAGLYPYEEPPARLHGDLWAGNAMVGAGGEPVLVDPAAYGGHREIDLAMMRLFGGFSERVFAAYAEELPLADGHADRVRLGQVLPLLIHAVLFGGAYGARAAAAAAFYVT